MTETTKSIKKRYKENENLNVKKLEKVAKELKTEDVMNRSLFTQFLNSRLNDQPKEIVDLLAKLRRIEHDIGTPAPSKYLVENSLKSTLFNYILSKPTEKSSKKVTDIAELLYNDKRVGDLFRAIDRIEEHNNKSVRDNLKESFSDEEIKNFLNMATKTIFPNDELKTVQFNPNYPAYLATRFGSNLTSIVANMNEVEDGRESIKELNNKYNEQQPSKIQSKRYTDEMMNDLNQRLIDAPDIPIDVYNITGVDSMLPKQINAEIGKKVSRDLKNMFTYYGKKTGKEELFKQFNNNYNNKFGANAFYFSDDMNDTADTLFGKQNSQLKDDFKKDLETLYINQGIFLHNITNSPDKNHHYYIHKYEVPDIKDLDKYNEYVTKKLGNSKLNNIRDDIAQSYPIINNSILQTGNKAFVDSNELIKYFANRDIEDIKTDRLPTIENLLFKDSDEESLKKYYKQLEYGENIELQNKIINDDFDNIDMKYYPLIYSHYKNNNFPMFNYIKGRLEPNIRKKISEHVTFARNFLEDERNMVTNLHQVNMLLANHKNKSLLPFLKQLANDDMGEEDIKQKIATLEGTELNPEKKEELQNAIINLKRIKKNKEFLTNYLEQYKYDNEDRRKLFEADDDLIKNYAKSLDALEDVLYTRKDPIRWDKFARYMAGRLRETKSIEEAEDLVQNAKENLGITSLTGYDTKDIELWLDTALNDRKHYGNGATTPDQENESLQEIIKKLNTISDTKFNEQSTLADLQNEINDLPNKVKQGVKDNLENIVNSTYNANLEKLHNDINLQAARRDELENTYNENIQKIGKGILSLNNKYKELGEALKNKKTDEEMAILQELKNIDNNAKENIQQIYSLFNEYDQAKAQIAEERKNINQNLEKYAQQQMTHLSKVEDLIKNIKITPDKEMLEHQTKAFQGQLDNFFGKNKEIIDNHMKASRDLVAELTQNSTETNAKLIQQAKELENIAKNLNKDEKHIELINNVNGLKSQVNEFSNKLNDQIKAQETYKGELAKTVENVLNKKNEQQKEQFDVLHNTFQAIADKHKELDEIAKGLDGNLKKFWDEHVTNKKLIDKDERYKARYDAIFKDEDKVRDALLKNSINITEDEDMKEKFFREKISQDKLKKALGFLPSDPDLKLSDVEKFLPDGFFADFNMKMQEKNMAPIKLKTTNYEAINKGATGGIDDSLKKKLLKLYIYYKDPHKKTTKKGEYPREFLNDLAMLNVNGSPSEITARYTKYLKTGSL